MNYFKTALLLFVALCSCSSPATYDVLIRNGQIIDGSGIPSYKGDVGINADTIAVVGDLKNAKGRTEIDAEGLAVTPGFINMLSWAVESLIEDGRSQSDIRQGVTLEVMGEGDSWGPLNEKMKVQLKKEQGSFADRARLHEIPGEAGYGGKRSRIMRRPRICACFLCSHRRADFPVPSCIKI